MEYLYSAVTRRTRRLNADWSYLVDKARMKIAELLIVLIVPDPETTRFRLPYASRFEIPR